MIHLSILIIGQYLLYIKKVLPIPQNNFSYAWKRNQTYSDIQGGLNIILDTFK